MKFEALTYTALSPVGLGGGVSAPLILGRSSCDRAEPSAAPISATLIRFWIWVQMQLSSLRAEAAPDSTIASQPSHIFHVPSATGEASRGAVRVNRSIMRKLKRLQRLCPASDFGGPSVGDEMRRLGLTMAQYLEYMIRCRGWSRVRVHGLRTGRHKVFQAMLRAALQGDGAALSQKMTCNALIEPD